MTIDTKTLNKRIDALGTKTAKWRDDVQVVLCACASRAYDDAHRDVDGFTRLIHKLVGADMKAVVRWIVKNTPSNWEAKKDTPYGVGGFTFNKSFKDAQDPLELLGNPWWTHAQQPKDVPELFDLDAAILHLVKRMDQANTKGLPVYGHGPIAETLAKLAKVHLAEVEMKAAA